MYQHPAILEACVIGASDAHRGETVKAVVVLRPDWRDESKAQAIIDWCRENMAAFKVPRIIEFVDALPKSGSGKIHVARAAGSRATGRCHTSRPCMKALLSREPGGPETWFSRTSRNPCPVRPSAHRGARLRRQFSGLADHPGFVPGQAAATVRAGRRGRRRRRCGRRRREQRAPGDRVLMSPGRRRHGSKGRGAGRQLLEDSRHPCPSMKPPHCCMTYGTSQHALKDPRTAQARQRPARARRGGRRRSRGRRVGQGHGRSRHRGSVERREACAGARTRRRRGRAISAGPARQGRRAR
jgi:hypothetical protein